MSSCSTIGTPRRFYLLKSQAARLVYEFALADTWLGKQEGQPGTDLPSDFPTLTELAAAHYTTVEDVTGAAIEELCREAGLTTKQAAAVIAAIAAL